MSDKKFQLPWGSHTKLETIIKAYHACRGPATLQDVVDAGGGISPGVISRNSGFLVGLKVLVQSPNQKKELTQDGTRLAIALSSVTKQGVPPAWRKLLLGSDFLNDLLDAIRLQGGVPDSALKSLILRRAGEKESKDHKIRANTLILILASAKLIEIEKVASRREAWVVKNPSNSGNIDDVQDNLSNEVFPIELVKSTRPYIEEIAKQVNGCYKEGWYDACLVMLRRLIETLIIECFESHNIASKIKDDKNNFLYLKGLISALLNEPTWSLGRSKKESLENLKKLGDKSAHDRRWIARRSDVKRYEGDIRDVVEELVHIADFLGKKNPAITTAA